MSISSASMTIRSAFGRRSGSKEGLSHLRIGMRGRWLPIALALSLRARPSAGTNHARNGRITANRTDDYIAGRQVGVSTRRRSERTSWLRFRVLTIRWASRFLAKTICAQTDD